MLYNEIYHINSIKIKVFSTINAIAGVFNSICYTGIFEKGNRIIGRIINAAVIYSKDH